MCTASPFYYVLASSTSPWRAEPTGPSRQRRSSRSRPARRACRARRGTPHRRRSKRPSWEVASAPRSLRHHPQPHPQAKRTVVRLNCWGRWANAHRPGIYRSGREHDAGAGNARRQAAGGAFSDSRRDRHGPVHVHGPPGPLPGASACSRTSSSRRCWARKGSTPASTYWRSTWRWEPLPGYEYASWETGYGDFKMVPDMTTLRTVPVAREDRHGDLRHQQ